MTDNTNAPDEQQREGVWDWLEEDHLAIPKVKTKAHPRGKSYYVPSPDVPTGMFLSRLTLVLTQLARGQEPAKAEMEALQRYLDEHLPEHDPDKGVEDATDEADAERIRNDNLGEAAGRLVMGDVYRELVDDGVSYVRLQKIVKFVLFAFTQGEEQAKEAASRGAFSGGVRPTTQGNRAARRQQRKPSQKRTR